MLKKYGVTIQHTTMKYKHTHTAFIEALNKLLTEHYLQSNYSGLRCTRVEQS